MPKKSVRRVKAKSSVTSKSSKSSGLSDFSRIERKIDIVLAQQKKLLSKESKIEQDEHQIETLEQKELLAEKENNTQGQQELTELKKIEALENDLKNDIDQISPLKKITYKDITKGVIGAFFGVVGHFAFIEGSHLSLDFTFTRSLIMYVVSFGILVAFLYFSGFRKITDEVKYKFLPLRAIVIYVSAILTSYLVLLLFNAVSFDTSFYEVFRMISSISVLAVLGAATADLIGKNEE